MDAAEIQIAMAESNERFTTARLERINKTAFFFFVRPAGVKDHAITRLERRLQFQRDAFARDARHVAKIDAAFLAKTRVHERLVVVAAEPAGIKSARKSHLQIVTRVAANLSVFGGGRGIQR